MNEGERSKTKSAFGATRTETTARALRPVTVPPRPGPVARAPRSSAPPAPSTGRPVPPPLPSHRRAQLPPPLVPPEKRAVQLLEQRLDAARAENEQLREQLTEKEGRCVRLTRTETELRRRLRGGQQVQDALRHQLAGLEERCSELAGRVATLQRQLVEQAAASRARLEVERSRQSVERGRSAAGHAPRSDDLTKLRGVGPRFERALQGAGVRTFEQIAAWTDADIDSVASRLRIPSSRIRRDGWVAAAQRLAGARAPS